MKNYNLVRKIYLSIILFLFMFAFDILLNEMIYGQFYYAGPFLELSLYILLILPIFFFKSKNSLVHVRDKSASELV